MDLYFYSHTADTQFNAALTGGKEAFESFRKTLSEHPERYEGRLNMWTVKAQLANKPLLAHYLKTEAFQPIPPLPAFIKTVRDHLRQHETACQSLHDSFGGIPIIPECNSDAFNIHTLYPPQEALDTLNALQCSYKKAPIGSILQSLIADTALRFLETVHLPSDIDENPYYELFSPQEEDTPAPSSSFWETAHRSAARIIPSTEERSFLRTTQNSLNTTHQVELVPYNKDDNDTGFVPSFVQASLHPHKPSEWHHQRRWKAFQQKHRQDKQSSQFPAKSQTKSQPALKSPKVLPKEFTILPSSPKLPPKSQTKSQPTPESPKVTSFLTLSLKGNKPLFSEEDSPKPLPTRARPKIRIHQSTPNPTGHNIFEHTPGTKRRIEGFFGTPPTDPALLNSPVQTFVEQQEEQSTTPPKLLTLSEPPMLSKPIASPKPKQRSSKQIPLLTPEQKLLQAYLGAPPKQESSYAEVPSWNHHRTQRSSSPDLFYFDEDQTLLDEQERETKLQETVPFLKKESFILVDPDLIKCSPDQPILNFENDLDSGNNFSDSDTEYPSDSLFY